jgi:arylsulfatase
VHKELKMPDDTKDKGPSATTSKPLNNGSLSRRKILLAGTSLAAATAINTVDRTQIAQAQQPQQPSAPSGRKPNILVIWGDDVGVANISAYSNGPAPPAARRSLPGSTEFARALPRWDSPVRRWA